jgi:chromosome segregation ATPase
MREGRSRISHTARCGSASLIGKSILFLIGAQILSFIFCFQDAHAQDVTEHEISELRQQLEQMEQELELIDKDLNTLKDRYNEVTAEKNRLTQELMEEEAKPKGIFDRIKGLFSRKRGRQAKLMTESRELADRISDLIDKGRDPLVKEFVALADELIDKASALMATLMDVVRAADLRNDLTARNEAWQQVSELWELANTTTAARNRYAQDIPSPEVTRTFPSLLSKDPDELRLGAAILKDWAVEAREESMRLEVEIKKFQRKQRLLEEMVKVSEDMQRSDEERGATGVGTAQIPWGSDVAKREIEDIKAEISRLLRLKQQQEADAERFESQSKALEQQASQLDAELKGKSEDE